MVDDGLEDRLSDLEATADDVSDWGPTIVFGDADLPNDVDRPAIVFPDDGDGDQRG